MTDPTTPAPVTPSPILATNRPRIVILGGGFAGAYCAEALEKTLSRMDAEVLLIDKNNYFIFYPLLVEAGTGSLEPRHAVVAIRRFLRRGRFRMGEVADIDFKSNTVHYTIPGEGIEQSVCYDHLVVAIGSVTNLPPVPGVKDHTFQVKDMSDAIGLRDHVIHMLELADATSDPEQRREYLRLVIVGGNFSGIEVAGEFDAFIRKASRAYPNINRGDVKVTVVERSDLILDALQDRDLSTYALSQLRGRGVEVLLQTTVNEVHPDYVVLSSGERIRTRTAIWNAGIAQNPLARQLEELPTDARGYILCERDLRVRGMTNVWGIGDCAVNIDAEGKAYPATAQHATREGKHCAANIARALRGEATLPCDLKNMGGLAALGCRTGVAKIMGVKVSGFLAWFLWRTVYLMKMPGWARRFRIALDWTEALFFREDYVQLGVHGTHEAKEANKREA